MVVVRISSHRTLRECSQARAGTSHAGAARTAEAAGGWRALQGGPEHARFVDTRFVQVRGPVAGDGGRAFGFVAARWFGTAPIGRAVCRDRQVDDPDRVSVWAQDFDFVVATVLWLAATKMARAAQLSRLHPAGDADRVLGRGAVVAWFDEYAPRCEPDPPHGRRRHRRAPAGPCCQSTSMTCTAPPVQEADRPTGRRRASVPPTRNRAPGPTARSGLR
jgi:hypothetical protein